jgi:hypothetical protein
MSFSS